MRNRHEVAAYLARHLSLALVAVVAVAAVIAPAGPVRAIDHILITEFAVSPTDGEFLEIHNPTANAVDLTHYFLSDLHWSGDAISSYWRVTDGALVMTDAARFDFLAQFPAGTSIASGQTIVISFGDDAAFSSFWSTGARVVKPDFELIQDGEFDGVPDMYDPGPDLIGMPYIGSAAGLSNGRDTINLFRWDGISDLVEDIDMVQWSDATNTFSTVSPNKTGVSVDGPDADDDASTYLPDTAPQGQDLASTATPAHEFGATVSRIDFEEGTETQTGGNGILGHDETSENYSDTWMPSTEPSIGSPGDFGPPTLLAAEAISATAVDLLFSRELDPATAGALANYSVAIIESPGGQLGVSSLRIEGVAFDADGETIHLDTAFQAPGALYEVRAAGLFSEDLTSPLAPGSRAFFRGFHDAPELRLEVPRRPYVPHLDGRYEITYVAPQGENILLRMFDHNGRELFTMAERAAPAGGLGVIFWDGRDDLRQKLSPGLYYLHLETPATNHETVAPVVIGVSSEETLR